MNLKTFARLGRRSRRLVWGGAITGLMLAAGTTAIGDVSPEAKRLADQDRPSLSLFAGPTAVLRGNQLQCGIVGRGSVCTDVFDSPTGGGGFWPTGSQNQYIFNTGLQIAGIMGGDGGPWANDTVGAYFFDARGTQQHGTQLTDVFDSLNPDDLENWPAEAFVQNEELFQPVLVGRATASQQDSWVQYWDGDPVANAQRAHPMGIKVTQRSLAWNFPAGNESLIYFIYNFQNVTDDPEFQQLNEAAFFAGADELPDAGITLNEIYAAFSTDMDVTTDAGANLSTAVLPFDLGISYHGGFAAPEFTYPSDLFFPPFFTNAPGLIGIKYLRSPVDPLTGEQVGLTLFSITINGAGPGEVPDPVGDKQLWRYLSGKASPAQGDAPCSVTPQVTSSDPAQVERAICFIAQTAGDTRFFQASGPASLAPGDDGTIVVAYIAAPTVEFLPGGGTSGISANDANDSANPPGTPSMHPGFPSARGCPVGGAIPGDCTEVDNTNPVKPLEFGAGWVSYNGPPPDSPLESGANKLPLFSETGEQLFEVVPGSLLGRSLVAQTIFDTQFLLGFAPEQPTFHLVPGNNSVTVVWAPSSTENEAGEGDPFFAVANDPASALFNLNYRQFDVEGYRVWRGTSSGQLSLIAQYDYADTEFTDVTCETVAPDEDIGNPAGPGFVAGDECPAGFEKTTGIDQALVFNNGTPGGNPGAGVLRLANGDAVFSRDPIVAVDSDESGSKLPLTNTGVPFVHVDTDVINNFTYFYSVSAFDVNSPASGPHSLRSARITQSTVPRADAPNLQKSFAFDVALVGDEGQVLDTGAEAVQPDPATGVFPGPQPPTNATSVFFSPDPSAVGSLLGAGQVVATLDSVVPLADAVNACPEGSNARGMCWQAHLTIDNGTSVTSSVVDGETPFSNVTFGEAEELVFPLGAGALPFSDAELARVGIPAGFGEGVSVGVEAAFNVAIANSSAEALVNRFSEVDDSEPGGSRWFDGDTETLEHPTIFTKAGELAGIDTIFHPVSHTDLGGGSIAPASGDMVCWPYTMSFLTRSADVRFTWGSGTFESVRDVTHQVEVPFDPNPRTTWGFMTEDANANGVLDWQDFDYLDGINQNTDADGALGFFCTLGDRGISDAPLAQLTQTLPGLVPVSTEGTAWDAVTQTGMGFGLYVNGEHYIFETSSMPAAGTEWTLRSYHGYVQADDPLTTAPSNYRLVTDDGGATASRPPMVAGLRFLVDIEQAGAELVGQPDLAQVHTVPDPFLGSSNYDRGPTSKQLMFVNLPQEATIRIYTLTGVLVDVLVHDDPSGGGRLAWNVRNRNNQFVASGVYFFHVMTPDGDSHVGKFTVVVQAGSN